MKDHEYTYCCNTFVFSVDLQNVIGKALRCFPDGIHVHAVDTGTQDPTQPGAAEFQRSIKTLTDLMFVIGNGAQFRFGLFVKVRIIEPGLKYLFVTHNFLLQFVFSS